MDSKNTAEESEELEELDSLPPMSPPCFAVHSPDGEEEKPLFDDDILVPLVELPPPPDGGWGWVICFASFMCNMILDGIAYTFGILLEPLVVSFSSNRSTVSWVGSLLTGVYMMSGPIVGGLVNKFGCRPVCIAGSIVACIGISLSTLSPNIPILMLTYGIIGGFGLGMIYLPAVVAVGYYFESKRALATGISVCGSGVGTFIFAPLATYLLEQFGWKGTNLIFAGLCLNCAIFGALMKPLELIIKQHPSEEEKEKKDFTVLLPDGTHHRTLSESSGDAPLMMMSNRSFDEGDMKAAAPSINFTHLPTIVEQTVTKEEPQEERKNVMDVFPPTEKPPRPVKLGGGRKRTISENIGASASKFHITPIKTQKREGIPRNSTAPNFVDVSQILSRNSSAIQIGGLSRLYSQCSEAPTEFKIFGISGSEMTSNTTLHLEPQTTGRKTSRPIVRPLYRKDIFYSGSIMNMIQSGEQQKQHQQQVFSQVPSFANLDDYRHSVISIPRQQLHSRRQSAFSIPRSSIVASHLSIPRAVRKASLISGHAIEGEGGAPILSVLKEMLSFDLLKNKLFLLVCISNVFGMLGFYTPFVFMPNMAVMRGISTEDANFLISIIGISNTVGRVLAGWLSDFKWVNSLVVTNFSILLSGVCVFVLPLCSSYASYVVVALFFGIFVAAYVSLTSIILVDLLGLDSLTSAFGLLVLFRGAASMVGSPLAGAVYDQTESFDVSFFLAGGFLVVAALISFMVDILYRRAKTPATEVADGEAPTE